MDVNSLTVSRTVYRITILGESKVGKTSILLRYLENNFSENQLSTIGFGEFKKDIKVKEINNGKEESKDIILKIFDTAGQERFQSLSTSMLKNAAGAVLVFDVCDANTFKKIEVWMQQVKSYTNNIPIILLGNKIDKEDQRQISSEVAIDFAKKNGLTYFETSAKTNVGIENAFLFIAQKAYDQFKPKKNANFSLRPINKVEETPKKGGCCGGGETKKEEKKGVKKEEKNNGEKNGT